MSQSMLEKVKQAIAEKFAPAIDFKAPYAKVMLDMAAKAVLEKLKEPSSIHYLTTSEERDIITKFINGILAGQ